MRVAARIQRIRLQCSVSLEEVEAKTGLTKSFMARLEKGREIPTLEMLDTLAEALDVPIHVFFYDIAETESAPRLTPRPALKQLADEWRRPPTSVPLPSPKRPVLAASKGRRISQVRQSASI
jgi:transcriptional regulator with XRE-family HTH domain